MTLKAFSPSVVSVNKSERKLDKFLTDCANGCEDKGVERNRRSSAARLVFHPNTIMVLLISCLLFERAAATTGTGETKSDLQGKREDLFSSTSKLEDLVEHEIQIVELLDTFVEYTISRANIIKSYIESQKQFLLNERSQPRGIVEHPVDAYLLVRRLTADWEDVQIALHAIANYSTGVHSWVEGFRKGTNFPQAEDLNGAAQALVRLQDTYQLDMPALGQGNVVPARHLLIDNEQGFHSPSQLSARDMLFLGRHALSQGLYNRAIDWLHHAESSASTEFNSSSLLAEIYPSLQNAIEVHDDVLERQGPRGVSWKTNPTPINPALANSAKYSLNTSTTFHTKLYQRQTEEEEAEHFVRLCRGENLRPPVLTAALKCKLKRTGEPYLVISPLKIEEASHDPYIVVVHDFVTRSQADQIIQLGKPKLQSSLTRTKNGTYVTSKVRTSQTAWIKDWEHPLMNKVTRRVYLVTGLKAIQPKEAEDYQIANYGLGGLYVPHTDHLMNNPDKSIYTPWERFVGDRVATLMIYLSDVDAGGATVFTRAGVTLWPRKGSAAFWWNLDRSGIGDDNTRHGACPVLHGNKWVSNKWIRLNEQFDTAPCGLHPLDKHKRP